MHDNSVRKRAPQNRLLFWFAAALIPEAAAYQIESPRAMAQRAELLRYHLGEYHPGLGGDARGENACGARENARGERENARGEREDARGERENARGAREDARGEKEDPRGEEDGRAAA